MEASAQARRWVQLALVVSCCVAFAPGLNSPLTTYDDPMYLAQNTAPGWAGFASVWSSERAWTGQFIEFFPLRDSVYWLLYQGFGLEPLPYHLASLLFHVLASLLVFRFVERLGASFWVTSLTALLFAVHPMHSESVTWVAGLKDPMYTCLMLASLLAFLRYRERQDPFSYALTLGWLVLALLVKSMALSTPLLLLALERFIGKPTPWKTVFTRLVAPALVCALFLLQYIGISRAYRMVIGPHGGTWLSHVVLATWAQALYLKQALVPASTQLIYCFVPATSLGDPRFLAGVAVLLGVAGFTWASRRHPLRLWCIAWYFACLLPVSNLVPFPAVVADRYLYAASLATCLLTALVLESSLSSQRRNVVAGLVLLVMTLTTVFRSTVWNDAEELWAGSDEDPACMKDLDRTAVEAHLRRYSAHLGTPLGLEALERAIGSAAIQQRTAGENCDVRITASLLATELGQTEKAIKWAHTSVKLCPDRFDAWNAALKATSHRNPAVAHEAALHLQRLNPSVWTALWVALTDLELTATDGAEVERAVRAEPSTCCPELLAWANGATPARVALLHGALELCSAPR